MCKLITLRSSDLSHPLILTVVTFPSKHSARNQPSGSLGDKIKNEGSDHYKLWVDRYWYNHATEIIRQLLLTGRGIKRMKFTVIDGWITAPRINVTGLGVLKAAYANTTSNNLALYAPTVAKIMARSKYEVPYVYDIKPVRIVANWVGYALSHYVMSKIGLYPMHPTVIGQVAGSDLCYETTPNYYGGGYSCSEVVLTTAGSMLNTKTFGDSPWHDIANTMPSWLDRPYTTEINLYPPYVSSAWIPDAAYPRNYTERLYMARQKWDAPDNDTDSSNNRIQASRRSAIKILALTIRGPILPMEQMST
ncbi:hypothetical protein BDV96DRAFT_593546 [Lophiotrema nucula]|uniref:Uncharacterized protein n=1 Tax=Lophiotrema nucula TaxID=690887 RepID=A0A6A5ZVU9_9PLEO|nr:hypothetical protein BDV96DRAFT_593546 [Lophiotrema nucula]